MFNSNGNNMIIIGYSFKRKKSLKNPIIKNSKEKYLLKDEYSHLISIDDSVLKSINLDDHCIPYEMFYFGQTIFEECILNKVGLSLAISMDLHSYKKLYKYSSSNEIYIPNYLSCPNKFPSYNFLGYDVADFMNISAININSYTDEETRELAKFKYDLNKFGLFSNRKNANQFKTISDELIKEHSPFYVFGLYEIQQ